MIMYLLSWYPIELTEKAFHDISKCKKTFYKLLAT